MSCFLLLLLVTIIPNVTPFPCNYYKPYTWGNIAKCKQCNCDPIGSLTLHCNGKNGKCECNSGHIGTRCERCRGGWYRKNEESPCKECQCVTPGSLTSKCSSLGQCVCSVGYTGRDCGDCHTGYTLEDGVCKACPLCTRQLLQSLGHSKQIAKEINPRSQDKYIKKIKINLKKLSKKVDKFMLSTQEKVNMIQSVKESVNDTLNIVYRGRSDQTLRKKAEKILSHSLRTSKTLLSHSPLSLRLDDVIERKNKHITRAYVLYEYAKSLPEKMQHLEVAPGKLKSIKEQVKQIEKSEIPQYLQHTVQLRVDLQPLLHKLNKLSVSGYRIQSQKAEKDIKLLKERLGVLHVNLVEHREQDLTEIILIAQKELHDVQEEDRTVQHTVDQARARVRNITNSHHNSGRGVIQATEGMLSELTVLGERSSELSESIVLPAPLVNTTCLRVYSVIESVSRVYTEVYNDLMQPVYSTDMVLQFIDSIDRTIKYQNLLQTKDRQIRTTKTVLRQNKKIVNKDLTMITTSIEICNHRLKKDQNQLTRDYTRLDRITNKLKLISEELSDDSTNNIAREVEDSIQYIVNKWSRDKKVIKDKLKKIKYKKRSIRSLSGEVDQTLGRMKDKLKRVNYKIKAGEAVRFSRRSWVSYTLAQDTQHVALMFSSESNRGTLMSFYNMQETLHISLEKHTLSLKCGEKEWIQFGSIFNTRRFSQLNIYKYLDTILVTVHQDKVQVLTQTIPCNVKGGYLVIGRATPKESGWTSEGFVGCIKHLSINNEPKVIRQASNRAGPLEKCSSEGDSFCGDKSLKLSSETLVKFTRQFLVEVLLPGKDETHIVTVGHLKIVAKDGEVSFTCKRKTMSLFQSYKRGVPFLISLEIFPINVLVKVGVKSRIFGCVLRQKSKVFVGSNDGEAKGCLKKLSWTS